MKLVAGWELFVLDWGWVLARNGTVMTERYWPRRKNLFRRLHADE